MSGREGEALLVIDMLNDFVLPGAPLEVPLARSIIPAIRRRIDAARQDGTIIVFVCDAHSEDDPEFAIWGRHAVAGTEGARVIEELEPAPGDIVLAKTTYSAFYKTRLEDILKQKNIKKLALVGILTNICVLFTAADAVMRGYRVEVPREAVAAVTDEDQQCALDQMEKVLRVTLS